MAEEKKVKIVGNKSDGYKYKYTSLGGLVLAGVDLPPMRVANLVDNDGNPVLDKSGNPIEYVEALIPDINSKGEKVGEGWIRGARIVVPSTTSMNEAQAYGSALTYARRYTALTVLGIACEDDSKLETKTEEDLKANENATIEELRDLYSKAGGADFDKWFKDNTPKGFNTEVYIKMKTTLLKQINKKFEEKNA